MLEKFLKKSGWTDLILSLIFIIFGIILIANPEVVMASISIILGVIFIVLGIIKIANYFYTSKMDNYFLAVGIISIIIGIVIMFFSDVIASFFRILIAVWIIYSGIMNLQTTISWKDYKSKLWIFSIILSILTLLAGIYILVNSGAIFQTIGVIILGFGIMDVIENIIFIKKVDNYLK